MKNYKLVISILVLIIIMILLISLFSNSNSNDNLKIYFFNAGKADAILISKDDKYIMIDTGEEDLSDEILTYFRINNITKLDYLIISHFDKDHVGSASAIIDNISLGAVLQSNVPKESSYYDNYINSLNNKGIIPQVISGDYEINISGINLIINGLEEIYEKNSSNNSSLIVSLTYDNNKFLFMGDAENARLKDYIALNNQEFDLIKIPYHGNYLKRLDDLIDDTNPKYGIMTCSVDEGCDSETLQLLDDKNIKYYMTKDGSITVISDGNNIKVIQN